MMRIIDLAEYKLIENETKYSLKGENINDKTN